MDTGFGQATVVVSTYNRPAALRLVLLALQDQSDSAFEVVVADDGSDERTRAILDEAESSVGYSLKHAWQEDQGFRLSRARNAAVRQARGDYLIFLDGDCLPRPGFIAAHRRLAERGWFVRGTRASLGERFTHRVESRRLPVAGWGLARWLWATAKRDLKDPSPLLDIPGQAFRKRSPERWRGAQTCNLGVATAAFLALDGFDEVYEGWGMDDADLAVRLIRSGVLRKEGKFATAVLHLWHPESDRSTLDENRRRFEETLTGARTRARRGISTHGPAPEGGSSRSESASRSTES